MSLLLFQIFLSFSLLRLQLSHQTLILEDVEDASVFGVLHALHKLGVTLFGH
jgi:hypothetical protein